MKTATPIGITTGLMRVDPELATVLEVNPRTAREMARDGRLEELGMRPLLIGGSWRVRRTDVERFLGLTPTPTGLVA